MCAAASSTRAVAAETELRSAVKALVQAISKPDNLK